MRRGTTPKHTFTIPFDTAVIDKVRVIYAQGDNVVLIKTDDGVSLSGNNIDVKLTQEETLRFNCRDCVKVQIRILTSAGDALSSDPCLVFVGDCLDDEVLE
jgi:3D (Asp-Asp-Asp) domain-containing protein